MLLVCALASALLACLWWLVSGEFLRRYGLVLMLLGTLVAITGGTELSRATTSDARAVLGAGPDREAPGSGRHLTAVGVFLFVALPLVVAGGLLVDAAR
ncbi:MAG: hypothetical protein JWM62_1704 [Frankiales bacterium]|nr:hypothetical protein [Frankiales bacterium]